MVSFFTTASICCLCVISISVACSSAIAASLPIPSTWYYLGPFLYGKTEYDGNPLVSCPNDEGRYLDSIFNFSLAPSSGNNNNFFFNNPKQTERIQKSLRYPSEVNLNGYVKWKPVQVQKQGEFARQFMADHYTQMRELQQHHLSHESSALEIVGFAVAFVGPVHEDGVYIFETASTHTVFFDDIPFSADQFGRNYRISVFLRKSTIPVRVSVRVRGSRGQSAFILKSLGTMNKQVAAAPPVTLHKHPYSPDLVCNHDEDDDDAEKTKKCNFFLTNGITKGSIIIQSHFATETLRNVQVQAVISPSSQLIKVSENTVGGEYEYCNQQEFRQHIGYEAHQMICHEKQKYLSGEASRKITIPPLHTRTILFPLQVANEAEVYQKCFGGPKKNDVEISSNFVITAEDANDKTKRRNIGTFMMKFRCRKRFSHSFLITYQDFDGSPAQSGIILPITSSKIKTNHLRKHKKYPILLSLHGTGVSPTSQADSYKYKPDDFGKDDDFIFGVDGAFVVAPDRHGAHNWEGVGKRSALHAAFLVGVNGYINEKTSKTKMTTMMIPDCKNLVGSSHSMGGHGMLILASQHPNLFIGAALLAPWITKEYYGDSNKIFTLDRSTEHTYKGSRRKMVIEASIADNELQLENLLHIPVFVRTGAIDYTVSPFFARRLVRMMRELGHRNVTHEEPKKQQHWWWDSKKPNDGGCMNDQSIRNFFAKIIDSYHHQQQQQNIVPMPTMTKFVSHSPFATPFFMNNNDEKTIFQQKIPMQKSTIILKKDHANNDMYQNIILQQQQQQQKFQKPFGPIRQYMEAPFVIGTLQFSAAASKIDENEHQPQLFGSLFASSMSNMNNIAKYQELDLISKYIADTSLVAFDIDAPVVKIPVIAGSTTNSHISEIVTKDLKMNRRLFALGCLDSRESSSTFVASNHIQFPFHVEITKTQIKFGNKIVINGTDLVLMTIFPSTTATTTSQQRQEGGILLFSQTMRAMRHAIHDIGMPTIPPMMRPPFGNLLPDFFISDSNLAHQGYGSFLSGGFFDENFEISEEMSFY